MNKDKIVELLSKLAPTERVIFLQVIELIYEDLNKKPEEGLIKQLLNSKK